MTLSPSCFLGSLGAPLLPLGTFSSNLAPLMLWSPKGMQVVEHEAPHALSEEAQSKGVWYTVPLQFYFHC